MSTQDWREAIRNLRALAAGLNSGQQIPNLAEQIMDACDVLAERELLERAFFELMNAKPDLED